MKSGEDHQTVSLLTQNIFRLLLDAISRPGRIYEINPAAVGEWDCPVPGVFGNGDSFLLPVLMTLLDKEVSFYVTGNKGTVQEMAEITGAHASVVRDADFVLVPHEAKSKVILEAKRGALQYPDEGATIIFCVERVCEGIENRPCIRLKGPSIADMQRLSITGIDPETFAHLMLINGAFPLGVDSFFVDMEGRVAAIPRSTTIEEVKEWAT
ncbi:MAG: phosphonate C-P lyase system protein PhnH [Syntrophales bacterium]|nr:phosphonate C-P lyase system protein PhnH [Syntrophales bacterium]